MAILVPITDDNAVPEAEGRDYYRPVRKSRGLIPPDVQFFCLRPSTWLALMYTPARHQHSHDGRAYNRYRGRRTSGRLEAEIVSARRVETVEDLRRRSLSRFHDLPVGYPRGSTIG